MTRPTHMVKGPQQDVLYASDNDNVIVAVRIIQSINNSMYYTVS